MATEAVKRDETTIRTLHQGEEPTIGRLVHEATADVSRLMRKEIELLKTELKVSVSIGAMGAGLLAAAAFIAVLFIVIFSIAVAHLIHWNGDGLDLHWAYLIVAGFYLLLAVLLGIVGVKKLKRVGPPEKAIEQGKQIPRALKGQA